MGQHLYLGAICHIHQPLYLLVFAMAIFSLELVSKFLNYFYCLHDLKLTLCLRIYQDPDFSDNHFSPEPVASSSFGYSWNYHLFHVSLFESVRSTPSFMFKSVFSISSSGCFTIYTKFGFPFSLSVIILRTQPLTTKCVCPAR